MSLSTCSGIKESEEPVNYTKSHKNVKYLQTSAYNITRPREIYIVR